MKSIDGVLERMRSMMGEYSIEAIAADGERPASQVPIIIRRGKKAWCLAVAELGREPTNREMYGPGYQGSDADEPTHPEGLE